MLLYYRDAGCYTCHGAMGTGGAGPNLMTTTITRAVLDSTIANDSSGMMSPFSYLTSAQRDNLVAFLAYLKTKQ